MATKVMPVRCRPFTTASSQARGPGVAAAPPPPGGAHRAAAPPPAGAGRGAGGGCGRAGRGAGAAPRHDVVAADKATYELSADVAQTGADSTFKLRLHDARAGRAVAERDGRCTGC